MNMPLLRIVFILLGFSTPAISFAASEINWLSFLNIPPDAEIGEILARLYVYGVGLVALAAFIMFVAGGVRYMVAGDRDPSEARTWMKNAFWGLALALTSWLILYTINPSLVNKLILKPPPINLLPEAPTGQSHAGCVENVCTTVSGIGTDDCRACGGLETGCLNSRSSSVYCKTQDGQCRLLLKSICSSRGGISGLCPSLCSTQ